jgi:hypothetical protein
MGKFSNSADAVGARLPGFPDPDTGTTGMSAFGKPVPPGRRANAYEHLKRMGVTDPDKRWSCVERMANFIERDNPHLAMEEGLNYVDATGVYRLVAVLCTNPG